MTRTILALGGNSGDSERYFSLAMELLSCNGFAIKNRSAVIRTAPLDCPPGTPDFSNMALSGEWYDTPETLLFLTQSIENICGRPRKHEKNQSRTLDIDIIAMEKIICDTPQLQLPHPRARQRSFVTIPVAELQELDPTLTFF